MSKPGTRLYGIGSAQVVDNSGETVSLQGIEDRIGLVIDEHQNDDSFHNIGSVTKTRKIFKVDDCEDDYQKRCWDYAKAPFLYVEAELFDGEGHPDSISAAAIMRYCARPDVSPQFQMGFSLDGGIIQRLDAQGNPTEDKATGKFLARTLATRLALTPKACCPKAKAFLFNDLTKSQMSGPPPQAYLDALKKSQASSSVLESMNSTQAQLILKTESLKKSLDGFLKSFTSMKCQSCGKPERFFKSNPPNKCQNCDKPFNLSQLWAAWNK